MRKIYSILCCISMLLSACSLPEQAAGQDKKPIQVVENIDSRILGSINRKYSALDKSLSSYSEKAIEKFRKKEEKIRKKLLTKDSLSAAQLLLNSQESYTRLLSQFHNAPGADKKPKTTITEYIPALDSLQTSIAFLEKQAAILLAYLRKNCNRFNLYQAISKNYRQIFQVLPI